MASERHQPPFQAEEYAGGQSADIDASQLP